MFVKFVGFDFELSGGSIRFEDFVEYLKGRNGMQCDPPGKDYIVYIDDESDRDYYVGLVVTIKDQKAFCKLVENGGR